MYCEDSWLIMLNFSFRAVQNWSDAKNASLRTTICVRTFRETFTKLTLYACVTLSPIIYVHKYGTGRLESVAQKTFLFIYFNDL